MRLGLFYFKLFNMLDFLQALGRCASGQFGKEEKRRANICAVCTEKEKRGYAEILNAKMVEVQGYVCTGHCEGCPIATKVFAKENKNICPKWK